MQIGAAGLVYAALPGVMGLMARNPGIETLSPYLLAACLLMTGLYESLVRIKPSSGTDPPG